MSLPVQEKSAVKSNSLTAMDRCDRCGAQAKVEVILTNGPLLFCSHHFTKVKDALPSYSLVNNYS